MYTRTRRRGRANSWRERGTCLPPDEHAEPEAMHAKIGQLVLQSDIHREHFLSLNRPHGRT